MLIGVMIGHFVIAALALSNLNLMTLVFQFGFVAILYSIYMALHLWMIYVYLVFLGLNIGTSILSLIQFFSFYSLMITLIILVCYLLGGYLVWKMSRGLRAKAKSSILGLDEDDLLTNSAIGIATGKACMGETSKGGFLVRGARKIG